MSLFSELTPEQKKLIKNCKSKEETDTRLKGFTALSPEELTVASGGDYDPYSDLDTERYLARERENCGSFGDTCKDVKTENVCSDFATGKITGADFFA